MVRRISTLDDMVKNLVDSVQDMDNGKLSCEQLTVKRNAYSTIVRALSLKLSIYQAMGEKPTEAFLRIA